MKSKTIRIGTRDSNLALWQAQQVESSLKTLGYQTKVVPVKSEGDIILDKPLYELGITGIFTKTLDAAMLRGDIDIAVHSMKDVPTLLPKGIMQAAVIKRASTADILVFKDSLSFLDKEATVATGSLRRKAQWLNKYPQHSVVDLRGNVNSRLQKLETNNWNGAIFASAGLDRLCLMPSQHVVLDWMTPAPAQGAMVVMALENDNFIINAVSELNDIETDICTHIERQFLNTLEGGCTAPIGALATYNEKDDSVDFAGVLLSIDGKKMVGVNRTVHVHKWKKLGYEMAMEILKNGGDEIMKSIKTELQP